MLALTRLRDRLAPRPPAPPPARAAAPIDFQQVMGRDEVTGLPNRHRFEYLLTRQSALASEFEMPLSVLVIDWPACRDDATQLRDQQLTAIATRLRASVNRKYDVLGSLGHGRIAVLLPFTDAPGADRVARNLIHASEDALRAAQHHQPQASFEPPEKPFGRAGSAPDGEPGDIVTESAPAAPAPTGNAVVIGHASYCGKGPLNAAALLEAAEQAATYASAEGADPIARGGVAVAV